MVLEKQDLAWPPVLNPPFSEEEMGRSKLNKHMQTQAAHCTGLSSCRVHTNGDPTAALLGESESGMLGKRG